MEAPEYFQIAFCQPFSSDSKTSSGAAVNVADHFIVEELIDFSNDDGIIADPTDSSTVNGNAVDSYFLQRPMCSTISIYLILSILIAFIIIF